MIEHDMSVSFNPWNFEKSGNDGAFLLLLEVLGCALGE